MGIAVVLGVLVRDGRVLLGHRHPGRQWYPDCWDLPGGHVEVGESPEQALVRECREELGIDVTSARPLDWRLSDPALAGHPFAVGAWRGEPTNTAPDEHDQLAWFRVDELAGLFLADPRYHQWLAVLLPDGETS